MGINLGGGGNRGGGIQGNGSIHSKKIEHSQSVHSYAIASGLVQGDGDNTGDAGGGTVLVSGRNTLGRVQGDRARDGESIKGWEGKGTREKEEDSWTGTMAENRTI